MRHKYAGNRLGRNSTLRKATIRDIAKATLTHQRITTTKARAKEARKLVERLITLGKRNTLAAKRRAFRVLCDHKLVSDLFNKIALRFQNRQGGYTRILPLALRRRGDDASLVLLELTEKEVVVEKKKVHAQPKSKKSQGVEAKEKAIDKKHKAAEGIAPAQHKDEISEKALAQPQAVEGAPAEEKPQGHLPPKVKKEHPQAQIKPTKKIIGGFKNMFTREKKEQS